MSPGASGRVNTQFMHNWSSQPKRVFLFFFFIKLRHATTEEADRLTLSVVMFVGSTLYKCDCAVKLGPM